MKPSNREVLTINKTYELRKVIKGLLDDFEGATYYRKADIGSLYPHKVYALKNIDLGDLSRSDLMLTIDIWDKSVSSKKVEEIADKIEEKFNAFNNPTDDLLMTFYLVRRDFIDDNDDEIQHIEIEIQIQFYDNEEE